MEEESVFVGRLLAGLKDRFQNLAPTVLGRCKHDDLLRHMVLRHSALTADRQTLTKAVAVSRSRNNERFHQLPEHFVGNPNDSGFHQLVEHHQPLLSLLATDSFTVAF